MSKSATYQQNNATFDTEAPLKFFSLYYKFATKTFWVKYIRQYADAPCLMFLILFDAFLCYIKRMSNLSSLKPITLRLPEEDLSFVNNEAEKLGITAGVYLRILVKESLNNKRTGATHQASLLRTLQSNLSKEAEQQGLDEQDILNSAKQARKDIAEQELQLWDKNR